MCLLVGCVYVRYFYKLDLTLEAHPELWLYDNDGKPVRASGDSHFDPPKEGMLVFNHGLADLRELWKSECINATLSGYVDGCFSDSSDPDTHGTDDKLNASTKAAFENGKVQTMSEMTAYFGGAAGQPYPDDATGVLIGKEPDQLGINTFQIEFFKADEGSIEKLLKGVEQGYMVQGERCMHEQTAANSHAQSHHAWFAASLQSSALSLHVDWASGWTTDPLRLWIRLDNAPSATANPCSIDRQPMSRSSRGAGAAATPCSTPWQPS
jgi:hypothetical protein